MTEPVAITGVRVFDGQRLSEPRTVVITGGVIGADAAGAETIDADGGVLLPGLIDAHIHLSGQEVLRTLCSYGSPPVWTWRPGPRSGWPHCAG